MGIGWRSALGAALWLGCAGAHAQTPAGPPPAAEVFGALPMVTDAAISPDGTKIVYGTNVEGVSVINVVDIVRRESLYAARVAEDTQLRGVGWASDTHVSFVMSQTFRPGAVLPPGYRFVGAPRRVVYERTGLADVVEKRLRVITTNQENEWQDQGGRLYAPIEGDPGYGRMIARAPGAQTVRPAVFRVNLNTGNTALQRAGGVNEDTYRILIDAHGAPVLRIDSDDETNRWRAFTYDGATPRLLMEDTSITGGAIGFAGLLADGRFAVFDADDKGFFRLYAIDRQSAAREEIFAREGFEVDTAIFDPWTRTVVGVSWIEQEAMQKFFEPALQAAYDALQPLFEDGSVTLLNWSRDRSRFIVYGEHGLDGGGYYVFTATNNTLARVSMRYPAIAAYQSGGRQAITYRSRDGVRIPAYLTVPAVETPQNLPTVIMPHGGPHQRDTFDFDFMAAFLASRGYAVLQPNFRGSSGYGAEWEIAGRGQWGGLMQTDVEDGVAALVRSRIADPARVCIVGGSYGGYAALAGATLTPDLYKCAVSINGVSDLIEFIRQKEAVTGGDDSMSADYLRMTIGDRSEDRARIREVSPANLAAQVKIPILLIHGDQDTVVPIDQSRRMHDRLRDAGKNVRLVTLRGDDHFLSDAETRVQTLRELETFLAAHIGSGAAP